MTKPSVAPVLADRALNRATLARQLLLDRSAMPVTDAVEHLLGLQAQDVKAPYVQLWSRLADFDPEQLSGPLGARELVRIVAMRSTIHLLSARDALTLRPFSQPIIDRELRMFAGRLGGIDLDRLVALTRELVEEQPRTPKQIREALAPEWPDKDPVPLSGAARCALPMVQVTPRGQWGRSGAVALTTLDSWLGRPPVARPDPEPIVLRYLAAFGPATVKDLGQWSGLTGLGEVVERLTPRLRTFRDEYGRILYDLPDAPRPDPDTPAPPRFLPEFDNLLLSHADRSRVVPAADRGRNRQGNQAYRVLMLDGFLAGLWRLDQRPAAGTATLVIELFAPLGTGARAEMEAEGGRLLATFAPGLAPDVRYGAVARA